MVYRIVKVCLLLIGWLLPLGAQAAEAIFAGGCFWCMEKPFDELAGVQATVSGYIGGAQDNPSYQQVSAGHTGHAEAVQVRYDDQVISYQQLLAVYWRNVDPFDAKGQFCDKGSQYRAAIFYRDADQHAAAQASLAAMSARFGQPLAVTLEPATTFYPAEDYHQDYYQRNPLRYRYYRHGCGRDKRLEQVWGKSGQ